MGRRRRCQGDRSRRGSEEYAMQANRRQEIGSRLILRSDFPPFRSGRFESADDRIDGIAAILEEGSSARRALPRSSRPERRAALPATLRRRHWQMPGTPPSSGGTNPCCSVRSRSRAAARAPRERWRHDCARPSGIRADRCRVPERGERPGPPSAQSTPASTSCRRGCPREGCRARRARRESGRTRQNPGGRGRRCAPG